MKHLTFRLKPNQLLKEEIIKKVKNIEAGVVLSIVGSLKNANLRMAGSSSNNQKCIAFSGPFEIVSGTGTISKNGCHIHISVANKNGRVIGGHLKDNCKIDTTVEIVFLIFDDEIYERFFDKNTGFKELNISKWE